MIIHGWCYKISNLIEYRHCCKLQSYRKITYILWNRNGGMDVISISLLFPGCTRDFSICHIFARKVIYGVRRKDYTKSIAPDTRASYQTGSSSMFFKYSLESLVSMISFCSLMRSYPDSSNASSVCCIYIHANTCWLRRDKTIESITIIWCL